MSPRRPVVLACVPRAPRPSRGVTLIELMIGLAVLAIMMMQGAPAFTDWIRNVRIRSAAESILSGIQLARTEAVQRNNVTRFQLVTTLDAKCEVSASGRQWVVNLDPDRETSPEGMCDKEEVKELDPNEPAKDSEPYIIQKASAASGETVAILAERDTFSFNSLGQQLGNDPATIDIQSAQGSCVKADGSGGTVRCLRIEISRNGQAKLCDPGLNADVAANRGMACQVD